MFAAALLSLVLGSVLDRHHHHKHAHAHHHLRHARAHMDPQCHEGITDATLTHCCQADCGECSDGSPICVNQEKNGRGSTCCPSVMALSDPKSCEFSMAPCELPAYVRADESAADLVSADGVANAAADCNKAVPDEKSRHLLATHFVKIDKKDAASATTRDCSARSMEVAAAECDKDNTCNGMTTDSDGAFKCFLVAGSATDETADGAGAVFFKKEGSAGQTYHFHTTDFTECSKSCGDGVQTRTVTCMSSQGETAATGMCSLQVAMNADALPAASVACNTHECPE